MYTNLDKANNSKDSKIEESMSKAQEPKAPNLYNSLRPDIEENTKTFDKA